MARRPILLGVAERVEPPRAALPPESITPITRSLLDAHPCKCGRLDCDGSVTIRAKCHREAGVRVSYQPATGCALLVCAACGVGVARLQLAAEVPS